MTRRERLCATLRGEPVDRPAFNFYEINGLESTSSGDPFNIYSDPSWKPMVDLIHRHGGYARVHSHGRLKDILDFICATGCDGLDPIEPPDQGDVDLAYVREHYGRQLVLFGNLEASDLENLPTQEFEKKVRQALKEGPGGRGFVLMPSACPYGRKLSLLALANYETMVRCVEGC